MACAEACPARSLTVVGQSLSVDELLGQIRKEYPLYRNTGGGVTLSGGEPTQSAEFAASLAARLRNDGIHVALETCGWFTSEGAVPRLLDSVELVLFDIKIFEAQEHRDGCGQTNGPIKDNLAALANETSPRLWPRLPLIPGWTDDLENLRSWAGYLTEIGLDHLTLVPYHRMGEAKRRWLSMPPGPRLERVGDHDFATAAGIIEGAGIECFAPGQEPWD